ncbi:hypothetical protein VNO80_30559 [Phaseolus coccineus]|uniref:Uncharacterized protein n=1 Tax=Phaseolus coccineus TaxID=3886 RepID=A0AAN9QFW8_PHACN
MYMMLCVFGATLAFSQGSVWCSVVLGVAEPVRCAGVATLIFYKPRFPTAKKGAAKQDLTASIVFMKLENKEIYANEKDYNKNSLGEKLIYYSWSRQEMFNTVGEQEEADVTQVYAFGSYKSNIYGAGVEGRENAKVKDNYFRIEKYNLNPSPEEMDKASPENMVKLEKIGNNLLKQNVFRAFLICLGYRVMLVLV